MALASPGAARAEQCEPLHLATFALDERAAELVPDLEEGHDAVLSAFADQHGLVKTVKNENWMPLIRQLQGPRFRTSITLPPPGGRGMWFFGKYSRVGLVWDRRKLDLSDAFIWPSGYFAKSEFNVDSDGSLQNGRAEALVTLEDLMRANQALTYECMGRGTVTGETLPYNEILGYVDGTQGLVGMFARSTKVVHLLFAMGIRALLSRALPILGALPIFVHDPERGMRPFGRRAQSALVTEYLLRPRCTLRSAMLGSGLPCLPLDTHLLDLGELEQLVFQGTYGITEESLAGLVNTLLTEDNKVDEIIALDGKTRRAKPCPLQTRALLALGLRTAVEADNASSALSLVRHVAPLLVASKAGCISEPLALNMNRCRSAGLVPVSMDGEDFVTYLHGITMQANSPSVLVAVGAAIVLEEFASGLMMPRIMAACRKLEAWFQDSASLFSCMAWWGGVQAAQAPSAPEIKLFFSRTATMNRKQFYDALLELRACEESNDVLDGMGKLYSLVSGLHRPCICLGLLRQILGLDDRYDLEAVAGVASLALQVVSDALHFVGPAPARKQSLSPCSENCPPDFQLEAAARTMQGLDREDKPSAELLVASPSSVSPN